MVCVKLTGLSEAQSSSLHELYKQSFITERAEAREKDSIECSVCRLDHPPLLTPRELTVDGQYVPRMVRRSGGIELTGANFEAWMGLDSTREKSWLGVAREHELAKLDVIENFLRVFAAHYALKQRGVLLHSAGLVFNGRAYIFSGRSNAGKTTLTRKAYKFGAWVLSDDINLLLPDHGRYLAHAVPFTGEFGRTLDHRDKPASYPVAAIILLEQGEQLKTESLTASSAVARLLVGSPFVNTDADESSALFESITNLVTQLPVIALQSRRDDAIEDIMKAVQDRLGNEEE